MIASVGILLAGCQTTKSTGKDASDIQDALMKKLTDIDTAQHSANTFTVYYLDGADTSRRKRERFNTGIWAFNTYTLLALGMGYHADNAYLSALGANALSGLDGLTNSGGEKAWLDAVGRVNCISGNFAPAAAYDRGRNGDVELELEYDATLRSIQAAYVNTYIAYRTASAQERLDPAELPQGPERAGFVRRPPVTDKAVLLPAMKAARTAIIDCGTPKP